VGGGGGSSGPTLQQQQLETEQALTTANLNLEENSQRKSILNSMLGTRVFRGSPLARAVVGNTPGQGGSNALPAPSASQHSGSMITPPTVSLLDPRTGQKEQVGATTAGGVGQSSQEEAAAIAANIGSRAIAAAGGR
jgi:hypothetical protein